MGSKITQLTENTAPISTDQLEMVDDPAGTALSQKVSFANATKGLSVMVGDSGSGGVKGLVPVPATGDASKFLKGDGTWAAVGVAGTPFELVVACSDEDTPITTGTTKVTFRMPRGVTLTGVRANLKTPAATGTFTVDINEGGSTILSTKITIDATEKTTVGAAVPSVISDPNLADDAEITVDVDDDADGAATGLKITLIGVRA